MPAVPRKNETALRPTCVCSAVSAPNRTFKTVVDSTFITAIHWQILACEHVAG